MKTLFILLAFILFSCNQQPTLKTPDVVGTIETSTVIKPIYTYTIDGCEYIGSITNAYGDVLAHKGNCTNPIHHNTDPRSYQFQITNQDHAFLYDGDKIVGIFKFTNTELDSLIKRDNL